MSLEEPQDIIENVAARMAELRQKAGLTQADVAERLGMTLSNYQRVEHGLLNMTVKTMVRVANALGVPTATFFAAWTPNPRSRKRGRPRK